MDNLPATQTQSSTLTQTSLPPSLKRAVDSIYNANFTQEMPWSPPKSVTVEQVSDARGYVAAVTAERPPVSGEYLSDRLSALMSHYFVAIDEKKLKLLVAADWIDTLRNFPGDVVHKAITEWRDSHTGKPTPAHIRSLCIGYYGARAWDQLQRAKVIAAMTPTFMAADEKPAEEPWRPPTAEEKANVARIVDECLRKIRGAEAVL